MSAPDHARSQFVICLAGHIDHGKSALVQALTGGKVDRLPEERRRGITIDLGFAHFDSEGRRYALVDVPGHERFVHTMVAGASGVDAAVLVIAADDSVMPQTREHLALLEQLQFQRGVVAITKCDVADEEQLSLVDLDVAELVKGTFLEKAARIPVSAHKGTGVETLRTALTSAVDSSSTRPRNDGRFRLPIDRAFSPEGQGAVVTGTVWRGTARVGDTLQLLPAGETVRIRRLQSQGKDVESVSAGERAAINLAGIKASAIRRGDELATPDTIEARRRHLVQLRILPDAKNALKHRQFVRLHLGANQTTAQVLMEQREVAPGESAFAVLRCLSPIVAEYGQPFVLRQLSPVATIGGGTFLSPALRSTDRFKTCLAAAPGLASADPSERLLAYIAVRGEATLDDNCESSVGLGRSQSEPVIQQLLTAKKIFRSTGPQPIYVTADGFHGLKSKFIRRLQRELERRRPASQVPLSVVLAAMKHDGSDSILEAILTDMAAHREIIRRGDRVGLTGGPELTQKQRHLLDTILGEFASAGRTPPTDKELAERHKLSLKELSPLLQVGADDGQLLRLSQQMSIDRAAVESLRRSLADYFQSHQTAKVGELREQWGITRKHAVPIFEFFDEQELTVRDGDLRTAGPRLLVSFDEANP
jgi:selenocysteine-specific elongation factor